MTDFCGAFRNGQVAAENADSARKEIAAVFDEINNQLHDPTAGRVEIYRQEYEKERDVGPYEREMGRYSIAFSSPPRAKEKYWGVAVRNPKAEDKSPRRLALWEQSRGGYPCKVSWGNVDHNCNDKESLEGCLASMLEDAIVGETIAAIMRIPDAKPVMGGATKPPTGQ